MESSISLSVGNTNLCLEAWLGRLVKQWVEDDSALIVGTTSELGPVTFRLPPPDIDTIGRADRCHCAKLAVTTLMNPLLRISNASDLANIPSETLFEMQRLPYLLMSQPDALQLAIACALCRLWNAEEQRVHGFDTDEPPVWCSLRLPFSVVHPSLQPRARLEFNYSIGRDMHMCLRGR